MEIDDGGIIYGSDRAPEKITKNLKSVCWPRRKEERRVGKESGGRCRARGEAGH
jgi:hypothetical protein